jgi:hypothetical protein
MKRFRQSLTAFALVAGLIEDVWGLSGSNDLLINGSFESPVISGIDQQFTAPSTAISGWVLTERTVDINRTSSIFGVAHSGDQMVDINGQDNGTLEQSIATLPDQPYELVLDYANNPNPSLASPEYNADVTLLGNGVLYTEFLTHSGSTSADMHWTLLSHSFIANSNSTTLRLRSRRLGPNGVVFEEPTCVVLFSLGFLGKRETRKRTTLGLTSLCPRRPVCDSRLSADCW